MTSGGKVFFTVLSDLALNLCVILLAASIAQEATSQVLIEALEVQVSEISGGSLEEEELEDLSLSVTATGALHLDGVDLGDVKAQSVLERLKQEVGKSRAAGIRLTLDQNLSIAVYADLYQSFAGKRVTLVVDPGASDE